MHTEILGGYRVRLHTTPPTPEQAAQPTVLLLHSSGLSGRQWRPLAAALGRRALAPSLLGYEESDPLPPGQGALLTDLAVAEALLLQQDAPVDLVGHSYGGALALRLATRHPERVRRIVVHEPVSWGVLYSDGPQDLCDSAQAFLTASNLLDPQFGGSEGWMQRFVDYWSGPGAWAQMPPPHQADFLQRGAKIAAEVRDLCLDRTPAAAYMDLDQPVTITVGQHTPVEERGVCDILAAQLRHASRIVLPGGHMAPVSHAAPFIAAVQAALLAPSPRSARARLHS